MKIKLGFFVVLFCCAFSVFPGDGESAALPSTKSEKPKMVRVYAVPVCQDFCCERVCSACCGNGRLGSCKYGCPMSAGMVGQGVGTLAAISLVALVKDKDIVDVTKGFLDPHPLEGRDHRAEGLVLNAGLLGGFGALVLSLLFPVLLTKEELEKLLEQAKISESVQTECFLGSFFGYEDTCRWRVRISRDELQRAQELDE